MRSLVSAGLLRFLCTHRLITRSVNLVLLGKTSFTVHTKMGVILALPGFDLPLTAVSTRAEEGVQM